MAEKHHRIFLREKDDEQIGGTDKRNLCAECAGQVVLWMPLYFAGNGAERSGERETRVGETSVSLVLKKEEVRLRSPLPSGSWQRQQGNGCPAIGFITCSLDVKQAFDNVSPENLSLVMKEMGIDPFFWLERS